MNRNAIHFGITIAPTPTANFALGTYCKLSLPALHLRSSRVCSPLIKHSGVLRPIPFDRTHNSCHPGTTVAELALRFAFSRNLCPKSPRDRLHSTNTGLRLFPTPISLLLPPYLPMPAKFWGLPYMTSAQKEEGVGKTSSGPNRPAVAIGGGIFGDLILG